MYDEAISALRREIETIERLIPNERDEFRQREISGINAAIKLLIKEGNK